MARYTSAYSGLAPRLQEIETIVTTARAITGRRTVRDPVGRTNSLCRGGIVLLSSHVEAYIKELSVVALERVGRNRMPKASFDDVFKYYLSRDLIRDIQSSQRPDSIARNVHRLYERDGHIWDASTLFTQPLSYETFVADVPSPNHDGVCQTLRRFGYTEFHHDLQAALNRDFMACRTQLDHVVDQRNKIAHGDFTVAGSPTDLDVMRHYVKAYCRQADQVVGDWFRTKGCPIR